LFPLVSAGLLTEIVKKLTDSGQILNQNDYLQWLNHQDEDNRTPVDVSCYLNYKNIAVFLMTKLGPPKFFIDSKFNLDKDKRSCFHAMCFKGNNECLTTVLNYERECLKNYFYTELYAALAYSKLKTLDIVKGKLSSTKY